MIVEKAKVAPCQMKNQMKTGKLFHTIFFLHSCIKKPILMIDEKVKITLFQMKTSAVTGKLSHIIFYFTQLYIKAYYDDGWKGKGCSMPDENGCRYR